MSSSIGAALALLAFVSSARAQGTLSLCTGCTGSKPRIVLDGVPVFPSDNVWVEVLVAGANGLLGAGGEPFQPFQLTFFTASQGGGLIVPRTVSVVGIPGGNTVEVTIRAWDKNSGIDYDLASVRDSTTFTMTLGGIFDHNGIQGLPNLIVPGFTGLKLASVPSLTVARSAGGKVRLAWRIRADGSELQGTVTLGGAWMPVEFTQIFGGPLGFIVVEVSDEGEHRFYRLAKP